MFYKTAKLRNMLNRLEKQAIAGTREKRAIAALLGPLFRAASRAPLTTAAAGLGGMAGYEFARQPKKLANPALLPNASTAPPQNNDAGLQKTSLDRQILGALLRR